MMMMMMSKWVSGWLINKGFPPTQRGDDDDAEKYYAKYKVIERYPQVLQWSQAGQEEEDDEGDELRVITSGL